MDKAARILEPFRTIPKGLNLTSNSFAKEELRGLNSADQSWMEGFMPGDNTEAVLSLAVPDLRSMPAGPLIADGIWLTPDLQMCEIFSP